jgi:intracellular septation protein A
LTLRGVGARFGPRILSDALAPVAVFLLLNNLAGLRWAMAGATGWAVGLAMHRRRRGRAVGPIVFIVVGYLLLRGTAGVLTRSDAVFFGPGIATNFLIGGVFLLSVLIRRPIIGLIARAFYPFPRWMRRHPAFVRIFGRLTLLWGGFLVATGTWQAYLILNHSTNTFVIGRTAVGIPLAILLLTYSLRYPRRAFAREPECAAGVEAAEEQIRQARERRRTGSGQTVPTTDPTAN